MNSQSPQERWVRAREQAFLAAHDQYADPLFRHVLLRVRDREKAKDIVQESFTRAWVYLAQGNTIDHMRAFLYRVANNLIVDGARRKRAVSLDSMMEEDGFEPQDESIRAPLDSPALKAALSLLAQLDEAYRTVITMRFLDGLSPKEIAAVLNVSENVVSVRIHRGIERLRKGIRGD